MATASIPAGIAAGLGSTWPRLRRPADAKAAHLLRGTTAQAADRTAANATRQQPAAAWRRESVGGEAAVNGTNRLGAGREMPEDSPGPGHYRSAATDQRSAAVLSEQAALADLARRCLAGDPAAWENLARSQHRRVYGLCFRFTGSPTEAEDLTQEVFLKIFRNLANFDPQRGNFGTWLTTLTRNLLVDHYRRNRLERHSDSLDEPLDGEDDGPSRAERLTDGRPGQEKHVAGMELRVKIQQALEQVSPDLREAVILRDLEDMDYKDIAEVLGVPQGTVKSRISRGRSELARLLKNLEGQVM